MAAKTTNKATGRSIQAAKEKEGKLTTAGRVALPKKEFALPPSPKAKASGEKGSYPIPDKAHARNALARVAQHGSAEQQAEVRRKVHEKYPEMGKKKGKA